jgi:hypothetical protein
MKATFHRSQYGTMFVPSTDQPGMVLLMWFRADSRARTLAAPERVLELLEHDPAFGARCGGLLARYDPASRSLKTLQCLLFEDSTECLATLPNWGLMRTGELWERTMPGLPTSENESGLWPTPCLPGNGGSHGKAKLKAMIWPTPQSHNYKEPGQGHIERGGTQERPYNRREERERQLADSDSLHEQNVLKEQSNEEVRSEPRERPSRSRSNGVGWWASEPELGRVAHGVAHRVDRLKAIGNGQVPAVVKLAWETLKP